MRDQGAGADSSPAHRVKQEKCALRLTLGAPCPYYRPTMTANELRAKYIAFFVSKDHVQIQGKSLIPENDPTVLCRALSS